jgi:small subunit ribosomal protein S20
LANIKSAIKRNRQNAKLREHNKLFRSSASGYVRKANLAIQSGDVEKAKTAIALAASALDKAAAKKIIHKNNAGRRKGALMRKLAAMGTAPVATAASPKKAAKKSAAKPAAKAKKTAKAKK